jgi:hypothetical protein
VHLEQKDSWTHVPEIVPVGFFLWEKACQARASKYSNCTSAQANAVVAAGERVAAPSGESQVFDLQFDPTVVGVPIVAEAVGDIDAGTFDNPERGEAFSPSPSQY